MFAYRLKRLTPYVPGEQPQDRAYLKLNTNENPYPPSPKIRAFLESFDPETLRLYPDPRFGDLRRGIAERYAVGPEHVFVGNGSDEVLSFAFFAFFDSSRGPLLFPEHTYSFYPVYCTFYGIEFEKIPLKPDFAVDVDAFLTPRPACGLIFSNPNAPTGRYTEADAIRRLLEGFPRDRVIILDEAYIDFGGDSALPLIEEHENLLVVRTFSKSMSLAGLRLGFALGSRPLVDALFTTKDAFNSYPADALSLKIGEIALSDTDYYRSITDKIMASRSVLSAALSEMGWRVLPSRANFIFASKEGLSGKDIYLRLKQEGILVRHFDVEGITDFVRITIGRREDMDRLLRAVKALF